MPPAGRVEGRDAHQPVHAPLGGEEPVGVLAVDGEGDALDAGLVALAGFVQLDVEAPRLRPAQVHAQEHLGPVLALGAPGARVDADDGVAGVELPGEQPLLLQALEDPADLGRQPLDLFRQLLGHLVAAGLLGGHVEQHLQVVDLRGEVLVVLQPAPQAAVAGAQLLGVVLVVPEVRGAHRLLEGGDVALQRIGVKDSPLPTGASRGRRPAARDTRPGRGLALSLLSHMRGGL